MNIILTCLISSIIFVLTTELFYFLNFSSFSLLNFKILQNPYLTLLILILIIFIGLFTIYLIFKKFLYINRYKSVYFILSAIVFLCLYLILRHNNLIDKSIQGAFSLFFSVILATYQYFYSIFYTNVVK